MGGETTFLGSAAETTNLYLQHPKKMERNHSKCYFQEKNKLGNTITQQTCKLSNYCKEVQEREFNNIRKAAIRK